MTPIDLIDYADHSVKIHPNFLKPKAFATRPASPQKIILSHLTDFFFIGMTAGFMGSLFSLFFQNLLVTRALRQAFDKVDTLPLSLALISITAVSYFVFSFFFNHGQTLGMKLFGLRIKMEELSLSSSVIWAAFSLAVSFSAGLALIWETELTNRGFGSFQTHDYLYQELQLDRVMAPVLLLDLVNKAEVQTSSFEEIKKAA